MNAANSTIDPETPFVVETDASNAAISSTFNQVGRPVAFFSRKLNQTEQKHYAVKNEAYIIKSDKIASWRLQLS